MGDKLGSGLNGRLEIGAFSTDSVCGPYDASSAKRVVSFKGDPQSPPGQSESAESGDGNALKTFVVRGASTGTSGDGPSHGASSIGPSSGPVYCAIEQSLRCISPKSD